MQCKSQRQAWRPQRQFQPYSRKLAALPEHAQVVHVAPATLQCSTRCHDDARCEAGSYLQDRMVWVAQLTPTLIDTMYSGTSCSVTESIAQIYLESRAELELMAQILVSKASADPKYSEVCAVVACTLQQNLPLMPGPPCRGKKVEKLMHVLLDVLQTEFESLFLSQVQPLEKMITIHQDNCARQDGANREQAILHFGAHLCRMGRLGERVVSQMVHDLIQCGSVDSAHELLHVIGLGRHL